MSASDNDCIYVDALDICDDTDDAPNNGKNTKHGSNDEPDDGDDTDDAPNDSKNTNNRSTDAPDDGEIDGIGNAKDRDDNNSRHERNDDDDASEKDVKSDHVGELLFQEEEEEQVIKKKRRKKTKMQKNESLSDVEPLPMSPSPQRQSNIKERAKKKGRKKLPANFIEDAAVHSGSEYGLSLIHI